MYKQMFLCFCLVIGLAGNAFSQNPLISIPITPPTAASLGKFVDIPVNYSTGIPDITIPIHTLKEGPLQLPISLSYHASGLKVMEQASWVGAGWALNAGGVITRTVKGQADEEVSSSNSTSYLEDKGYYSYLFRDEGNEDILDYLDFAGGRKDGEPDLFFFNFNGYSGKFYFRADTTIAVLPEQDVRIKPLISSSGIYKLYGWVITTPDGVKYYFGASPDANDVDALETCTPYSFDNGITFTRVASSWYLYRIVSADSQFDINLTYESEEYSFYAMSLFPSPSGDGMRLIKNFIKGVRLRSIQSSNGIVDFIPEDVPRKDLSARMFSGEPLVDTDNAPTDPRAPKALKEIRIHGTGDSPCRSFGFSYSYFTSSAPLTSRFGGTTDLEAYHNLHTDKKRLKLNAVVEGSCDKTVRKPPYRFDYYDESSVPRTLSLAQDHWGFYNGANNTELIPPVSLDGGYLFSQDRGVNRESAWPQMRAGALKKIQYPTGGSSEFEFGAGKVLINRFTEKYVHISSDVTARGSSAETGVSPKDTIVVTGETRVYRVTVVGFGGARDGSVYLGDNVFGLGEHLIALAPGSYVWYAAVSGLSGYGSGQGIEGKIDERIRTTSQELVTIGGLRVEKITFQNSRKEPALVTTYRYKDWRGMDRATLYSRPNYISLVRNDRQQESGIFTGNNSGDHGGCIKIDQDGKLAYFLSAASIHPMKTTQGYHLGYAQVDVILQNNGYTSYRFQQDKNSDYLKDVCIRTIDQKICDPQEPNYPPAPQSPDFSRGELRSVSVYDVSGRLLRETHHETEYAFEQSGTHGLIVSSYYSQYLATEYELKTARKTRSSVLELNYDALNNEKPPIALLTETLYSSAYHQLPVKTTTFDVTGFSTDERKIATAVKGGIINETRKTYAGDIRLPSCQFNNTCASTRIQQEQNAFSTYDQQKAGCHNDAFCIVTAWVAYTKAVNNIRIDWVDCSVNYANTYRNCISSESKYQAASSELKAVIDLNKIYKPAEVLETTQWREDKLVGGSYVTYKSLGIFRQSEVAPLQQHMLLINAPVSADQYRALSNTDQFFSRDSRYEPENTYKFEKGNPVEITGKDGVVTAYIWGQENTQPIVKAAGVSYDVLNAAYQFVKGNVELLRQRGELQQALLTTYTYDALGMLTSQTDPNGQTTTYVYDDLGREKQLKDAEGNIVRYFDYQYKY